MSLLKFKVSWLSSKLSEIEFNYICDLDHTLGVTPNIRPERLMFYSFKTNKTVSDLAFVIFNILRKRLGGTLVEV